MHRESPTEPTVIKSLVMMLTIAVVPEFKVSIEGFVFVISLSHVSMKFPIALACLLLQVSEFA